MKVQIHADPVEKDGAEKEPDDWQKDNWVKTVTDAHEIMADPKKMKHVHPRLKRLHKAAGKVISSTAELRQKAKELSGGESDADDTEM